VAAQEDVLSGTALETISRRRWGSNFPTASVRSALSEDTDYLDGPDYQKLRDEPSEKYVEHVNKPAGSQSLRAS
jgi:hypothetical protein